MDALFPHLARTLKALSLILSRTRPVGRSVMMRMTTPNAKHVLIGARERHGHGANVCKAANMKPPNIAP